MFPFGSCITQNVSCPAGNGMVPVNNMSMSNGSSITSVGVNGSASPSITGGNVIPQLPELPTSGLPGAAGPQGQYALTPPADGSGSGDQQDPAYVAKQRQKKQEFILKQQRWLLFLRHCAKCQYPDGQCNYGSSCAVAKQLWQHILGCSDARCEYPRCFVNARVSCWAPAASITAFAVAAALHSQSMSIRHHINQ